jgi:hypothetical protein
MGETHLTATLREVERDHILVTLALCEGNRTRAAEALGISIRSLRNKLRDYMKAGFQVQMPKTGFGQSTIQRDGCLHELDEGRQGSDRIFPR